MNNKYEKWHVIKEKINTLNSANLYFKEREIWWCYLGANIGVEQDGKGYGFLRPVLIFKKFSRRMCWVIPLSTQALKWTFFFPLLAESNIIRIAVLPQMRMIDVKRLCDRLDLISCNEYELIKKELIVFMR